MKRSIIKSKTNDMYNKINFLLYDKVKKNLVKNRLFKIQSLSKNGLNKRKGLFLYYALLCNSIIEEISRRVLNEIPTINNKKIENEKITKLLGKLNDHGYISIDTYNKCKNINSFRNTIHLNPKYNHNTLIHSNNCIASLYAFVEEIYNKYIVIKRKKLTIVNIIGGCELEGYSDILILKKYEITTSFLEENYGQFIKNNKLVLITDYNIKEGKEKYQECIESLFREILLHEEGNSYSTIFMNGIVIAAKEFCVDENSVTDWINDIKFNYNHIRNVHQVFYKKFPKSFYKLINNIVHRQNQLIIQDPSIASDFALFLVAYSNNENLFDITSSMLSLYQLSKDHLIFEIVSDIYWPLSPQTPATTDQRIDTIKKLFDNPETDKKVLYQLLIELLPHKKSSCSGYTNLDGDLYDVKVTSNELSKQYSEFQELALKYTDEFDFELILAQNIRYLDYVYLSKFIDNYSKDARDDGTARKVYLAIFVFAFDSNTSPFIRNELSQILNKKNQYLKIDNLELFKYIFNIDNVNKQVVVKFFNGLDQEHIFAVLTSYLDSSEIESDFGAVLSDYKTQLTDNDISDIMDCVLSNSEKGEKLISSYLNFSYDNLTNTIIQKISKYSEKDRIKFLCFAPITDFTLSELNKMSPDSQQYFWENRSDFLNRFNFLSPENKTYVLNSLIQHSRPYALLAIFSMFNYMPIDNELFLKTVELLPSSKEHIPSLYYEDSLIGFAIDHIKNCPESDKFEKALKFLEEKSNYLFKEKCRLCEQGKNDSQKSQLMG